jgi:hypothetical protein
MADNKAPIVGPQVAGPRPTGPQEGRVDQVIRIEVSSAERRQVATTLAAAILSRQSGRTAKALAREAREMADALLAELQ